ncbi:acyl-CoA N-acyltransferase [Cristinia sonorae]|uniref:Acyl-CoA N-acyltransferase n=1 Tax=Cristinia sonorae TaxID=1940300 RepID=A0A8K0UXC9_9AGAR|nr:acyl-CoA N-acyltransferase [Cristinia sonorae]
MAVAATPCYIRRATPSDSPALSRICLLTASAGQSAASEHTFPDLPGLIYAEPYVHLPSAGGFVLVDPSRDDEVVGYVLGATDTVQFEREMQESWLPQWRLKYPNPYTSHNQNEDREPLPADTRYIHLIHSPHSAAASSVAFSPAHLHINLLPEYQRQGWGKKLIGSLIGWLREKGLDAVWLGMDPKNAEAGKFYTKLGFAPFEGASEGVVGLKFKDWKW